LSGEYGDAIVAASPLWHQLLERRSWSSIFLTPEWQGIWWSRFGNGNARLRLLTIGPEESPLGLAPMALDGDTLSFVGDTDLFDYHDFIDVEPGFHAAFIERVADEPWKTMDLRSLPAFSPAMRALPDAYRALGYTVTIEDEDVVPGVDLPATWDEFLSVLRKKDRHELRRKMRRLESAGELHLVETTKETLGQDFELFHELMAESREEKRDFMLPEREEFFRDIIEWSFDAGFLRLLFLELDGERVATTMSFDYGGRRLLYNSGYRLEHAPLAVGLMLNALCIKDAIERGLIYFDFLRGPEPYKYHLGGQDVGLHRIIINR
jgi:CelD/BcsL family acetyltransferase involved in cellulose biosynthesis